MTNRNIDDGSAYMVEALREDMQRRELDRMLAMTPAEEQAEERRQRAEAFEKGDHQPDGRVIHHAKQGQYSDPRKLFIAANVGGVCLAKPECAVLNLHMSVRLTGDEHAKLREQIAANPHHMQHLLRGLELEAVYSLRHTFGIESEAPPR